MCAVGLRVQSQPAGTSGGLRNSGLAGGVELDEVRQQGRLGVCVCVCVYVVLAWCDVCV